MFTKKHNFTGGGHPDSSLIFSRTFSPGPGTSGGP